MKNNTKLTEKRLTSLRADRIRTRKDEYYEWYSDAVNEYADEVHEAE